MLTDFVPDTDQLVLDVSVSNREDPPINTLRRPHNGKKGSLRHTVDLFRHRLVTCTNVAMIRCLVQDLELDFAGTPAYSSVAFKHLLRIDASQESLIEYLQDPVINVAAAENMRLYIEFSARKDLSDTQFEGVCRQLMEAIKLGTFKGAKIDHVINQCMKNWDSTEHNSPAPFSKLTTLIQSILAGVRQSSVLPMQALKGQTLNCMLCKLSKATHTGHHQSLIISILAAATPSQVAWMMEGIDSVFKAYFHVREAGEGDTYTPDQRVDYPSDLADFINSSPTDTAQFYMVAATRALMLPSNVDSETVQARSLDFFRRWTSALFQSARFQSSVKYSVAWDAIERQLMRGDFSRYAAVYLAHLSPPDHCQLILRTKVKPRVRPVSGIEGSAIYSAIQCSFEKFSKLYPENLCYTNLILALYRHGQPYYGVLHHTTWALRALSQSHATVELVERLHRFNIPLKPHFLRTVIHGLVPIKQRTALSMFELDMDLQLDRCGDLAVALIADPFVHPRTPLRFLGNCDPLAKPMPRRRRAYLKTRTRLVHNMAVAIAHAGHLSHQTAFREVHECYKYLRRNDFRIQPDMIYALMYSGIVRDLRAGKPASIVRINWLLRVMQEVSGHEKVRLAHDILFRWRGRVLRRLRRAQRRKRRKYHASIKKSTH